MACVAMLDMPNFGEGCLTYHLVIHVAYSHSVNEKAFRFSKTTKEFRKRGKM